MSETPIAKAGITGNVHGGQQPVSGASIQLYAVGVLSDGSAATSLISPAVLTDSAGNFNITNLYTCPSSSTLVYIVAKGGYPAPGVANPQLGMMTALGACGSLTSSTVININELTTTAAAYALAPYAASLTAVGSGISDASSLAAAFTLAAQLVNPATGTSPGTGIPSGSAVPSAQINTIGDILSTCINSPGGVAGDGSACGTLFSLTTPTSGTAPTDTFMAAVDLAKNPGLNTAQLYQLTPPAGPFQPVDTTQPADFSVTLNPVATAANLTTLNVQGNDVVWDASNQKLYVAVPSTASSYPGTITEVDPIAGTIVQSHSLSSAAGGLAISDDGQFLYAAINGGATIQRFLLPTITPDIQFTLPSSYLVGDMKVKPGVPHTLAVSYGSYGSGMVGIYDDSVARAAVAGNGATQVGNSLVWRTDGSELYAAYGVGSDSGYYTSVSQATLSVLSVNASGVTLQNSFNAFRGEGVHLHADWSTGYAYDDLGEVVNGTSATPVGTFRYARPSGTAFPGSLAVVDPTLNRYYLLTELAEPNVGQAYLLQSFNQTNLQLLSTMVIPGAIGQITNFIRWGQSGLAFVAEGSFGSSTAKLYLLDGTFVNPSGPMDSSIGTALTPVPTPTALSPITATVGSAGMTLTVTGRDFQGQPTVFWNGTALSTSLVSSTELQAQIPSTDLAAVGQGLITVTNPGSVASSSLPFSVNPAPPSGTQMAVYSTGGNALVWDSNAAKIYVSMPGVQGDAGDGIAIVDPVAGTVSNTSFLGSEPANLSIASDGKTLYAALYGQNSITRYTLPAFGVSETWNLGGTSFDGAYYALDLQAAPGAPDTTAVTLGVFNQSPSAAAVVIYDNTTPRPTIGPMEQSSLQWGGNDSILYARLQAVPSNFDTLSVASNGVTLSNHVANAVNPYAALHFDTGTGLIYTDGGQVIQPSNGSTVGSFGSSGIAGLGLVAGPCLYSGADDRAEKHDELHDRIF